MATLAVSSDKKFNVLARAIEYILYALNNNIIGPLAFVCNLLTYLLTSSKGACTLEGLTGPGGSNSSILTWLQTRTDVPNPNPVTGDVLTFFYNNQVIECNCRIKLNYKTAVSVITNVIHITDPSNNIQTIPSFAPTQWLRISCCSPDIVKQIQDMEVQYLDLFQHYRRQFICDRIDNVVGEQQVLDGQLIDPIDPEDVSLPSAFKQSIDPYSFIRSGHPSPKPKVQMAEPLMLNPNSYTNITTVQDTLLLYNSHSVREWSAIGCDGPPYVIASRLMEKSYECCICGLRIHTGEKCVTSHMSTMHPCDEVDIHGHNSFQNVLLLPGMGHIEMNTVQGLLNSGGIRFYPN
jgi:hypothetical protein